MTGSGFDRCRDKSGKARPGNKGKKVAARASSQFIFINMKSVKIALAAMVLLALLGLGYYLFGNYSDGYRAGTVMKLSRKGFLFKTYEGQLNLGMGIRDENASVSVSNIWDFSVRASDSAALRNLDVAMMSGKRAKLHYREKYIAVPWRGDTKYQVFKVDITE